MKKNNLEGLRFGRLTVVERAPSVRYSGQRKSRWLCRCDCGNERIVLTSCLVKGWTQSCGCLRQETSSKKNRTHSHSCPSPSPTYYSWVNMRTRCYNRKHKYFHNYGGRGVQVCARWFTFENFLNDMGERPVGKSIDRKNGDFHYMPSNCRWATRIEQRHNRRLTSPKKLLPF